MWKVCVKNEKIWGTYTNTSNKMNGGKEEKEEEEEEDGGKENYVLGSLRMPSYWFERERERERRRRKIVRIEDRDWSRKQISKNLIKRRNEERKRKKKCSLLLH